MIGRLGFEFERPTAPAITRSMRSALADLGLTALRVIHSGKDTFPLTSRVRAVAARRILEGLDDLAAARTPKRFR